MTIESLKVLLANPLFLFAAMMLAQFFSIVRQWHVSTTAGATMGFMELMTYWPQLLVGFGMSIVAFIGLVETDTLNFVSATAIGAMSNTVSPLFITT